MTILCDWRLKGYIMRDIQVEVKTFFHFSRKLRLSPNNPLLDISAKLTFPITCLFALVYLIVLVLELGIHFYFVLIFNGNQVQDCISKIYFKKHGYTIGERFVSHGVSIRSSTFTNVFLCFYEKKWLQNVSVEFKHCYCRRLC